MVIKLIIVLAIFTVINVVLTVGLTKMCVRKLLDSLVWSDFHDIYTYRTYRKLHKN